MRCKIMNTKKNSKCAMNENPISAKVGTLNNGLEMAQRCGNIKNAK